MKTFKIVSFVEVDEDELPDHFAEWVEDVIAEILHSNKGEKVLSVSVTEE